jgi:hypothetical protein
MHFFALLLLVAASTPSPAPDREPAMTLTVTRVPLASGGDVQFIASAAAETTLPKFLELESSTSAHHFRFAVDMNEINWDGTCQCFRYYIFYFQAARSAAVVRFKVKATPSGTFADHWEVVRFTIDAAGQTDQGEINLPLASAGSLAGVAVQEIDKIQDAYLNGPSTLHVKLRNTLAGATVVVDVPPSIAVDDRLWAAPMQPLGSSRQESIAAGADADLAFQIAPRPFEAAQRSFLHLQTTQEHAGIPIVLMYSNPQFKNRSSPINVRIRTRFNPSLWQLLLALLVGVALGSVLKLAPVSAKASRAVWLRDSLIGLSAAVALWFLGLFLVGFGSQFVLFTFNFDPWQTLPTLIVGLVCGALGVESVAAVRRALNLGEAARPATAPAAGSD